MTTGMIMTSQCPVRNPQHSPSTPLLKSTPFLTQLHTQARTHVRARTFLRVQRDE